jgi:hypothetical protein
MCSILQVHLLHLRLQFATKYEAPLSLFFVQPKQAAGPMNDDDLLFATPF